MPTPVIYDCDPGRDDALALIMACGHPALDLRGVTTVGGNQTLDRVTTNALGVLATIGKSEIPVFAGCSGPLVRCIHTAPDIHGHTGLDGVVLEQSTATAQPLAAVDYLIDTLMTSQPNTITVVATGPLTNLAMAVKKQPEIAERVKNVVIMGGAMAGGNVTAVAEFNIHTDPEAAAIVFSADWPVVMVGLDATHKALCPFSVENTLATMGTRSSRLAAEIISTYRSAYTQKYGWQDPPLHDPLALAYCINPDVITTVPAAVSVELSGTLTTGMTVCDRRKNNSASPTQVAIDTDCELLWEILFESLTHLA